MKYKGASLSVGQKEMAGLKKLSKGV